MAAAAPVTTLEELTVEQLEDVWGKDLMCETPSFHPGCHEPRKATWVQRHPPGCQVFLCGPCAIRAQRVVNDVMYRRNVMGHPAWCKCEKCGIKPEPQDVAYTPLGGG